MYIYVYVYISSSLMQQCWSGGIYWKWCNLTGQHGGHTTWGHEKVKFSHMSSWYWYIYLHLMDLYGQLVGKHTIPMDSTGYDMSPTAID